MIKVPENGRERFCVKVGAKELLAVLCCIFPKAFQRGEYMALRKLAHDRVTVYFLRIQGFGDLVLGPVK